MIVEIEDYRGFKIYFNPETSLFHSDIIEKHHWKTTDKKKKESGSFEAVKKDIDDFVKDNYKFEPFFVINNPRKYATDRGKIKIVGIRKDGAFVAEKNNKTFQISNYNEDDYMLELPENELLIIKLASLEIEVDMAQKKVEEHKEKIVAPTLKEIKPKYLMP